MELLSAGEAIHLQMIIRISFLKELKLLISLRNPFSLRFFELVEKLFAHLLRLLYVLRSSEHYRGHRSTLRLICVKCQIYADNLARSAATLCITCSHDK